LKINWIPGKNKELSLFLLLARKRRREVDSRSTLRWGARAIRSVGLIALVGVVVLASMGIALAHEVSSSNSPQSPTRMSQIVTTCPTGYASAISRCVPRECVFRSASQFDENTGDLTFNNGTRIVIPAHCLNGHNDAKGTTISSTLPVSPSAASVYPATTAWIEDTKYANCGWSGCSQLTSFSGNWPVPNNPATTTDGQSIYLFIGMTNWWDANPTYGQLIQNVLQWGPVNAYSCVNGGSYWGIANYYVGNNWCVVSDLKQVNVGDVIGGLMGKTSCGNNCYYWYMSTTDQTTGAGSFMNVAAPTMYNVYVTLEVHNVVQCSDYPASGSTNFYNLSVGGGTPGWGNQGPINDCPDESVAAYGSSLVILNYYYPPPPPPPPGGGCVAQGTPILTNHGYVPVQTLKPGEIVLGFDLRNGQTMSLRLVSNTMTWENSLIRINDGALLLTATNQPIYTRNSTYIGWVRDPQNLKVGESIYDAVNHQWVPIYSVENVYDRTRVYDVVTAGPNNFIANGYLLDYK